MDQKKWLLISLIAFLGACQRPEFDQSTKSTTEKNMVGIVGGQEIDRNFAGANSVIMIAGEDHEMKPFVCTGTFISADAILTAAHCLGRTTETMRIAFNLKPFEEPDSLKVLEIQDMVPHPRYRAGEQDPEKRFDIALIQIKGKIPAEAQMAQLPSDENSWSLLKQKIFLLGYGKVSGTEKDDPTDLVGLGVLRAVALTVHHDKPQNKSLIFDQKRGAGVCSGDSGGPAFRLNQAGELEILAVASAIKPYPSSKLQKGVTKPSDQCKQLSYFMKVAPFRSWIEGQLLKFKSSTNASPDRPL